MEPFATHQPVLSFAVMNTTGPVLEIGCGYGSTEMLHELCKGRLLVTLETDEEWANKFRHLENEEHIIMIAPDYEMFDEVVRQDWDVVLIDHAPGERRNFEIEKVTGCKFVVIHDTHDPAYEYEKTLPLYKHHFRFTEMIPFTTVVSNIDDLKIFDDLRLDNYSTE